MSAAMLEASTAALLGAYNNAIEAGGHAATQAASDAAESTVGRIADELARRGVRLDINANGYAREAFPHNREVSP